MNQSQDANPLKDLPPAEVPLADAPLVRVIAQVKFSEVLSVENAEVVSHFQTAIGEKYGVLSRESGMGFVPFPFSGQFPGLQHHQSATTFWRFADHPVDWQWRVTLTSQFLTLEVSRYTSRTEFFERLGTLLGALASHIKPTMMTRLGVRYINRITGAELADAALLVKPYIAGVVGTCMAPSVNLSVTESMFDLGDHKMMSRWGLMPANSTVDPSAVIPIDEPSFLLDLDVFDETPVIFDAIAITARAKSFAERSYAFFRWAITDEFLTRFGAKS